MCCEKSPKRGLEGQEIGSKQLTRRQLLKVLGFGVVGAVGIDGIVKVFALSQQAKCPQEAIDAIAKARSAVAGIEQKLIEKGPPLSSDEASEFRQVLINVRDGLALILCHIRQDDLLNCAVDPELARAIVAEGLPLVPCPEIASMWETSTHATSVDITTASSEIALVDIVDITTASSEIALVDIDACLKVIFEALEFLIPGGGVLKHLLLQDSPVRRELEMWAEDMSRAFKGKNWSRVISNLKRLVGIIAGREARAFLERKLGKAAIKEFLKGLAKYIVPIVGFSILAVDLGIWLWVNWDHIQACWK
jgi:hypothetical protein